MSDIAASKKNIQVEGARYGSAVSESLVQTIGGAINYLNAQDTTTAAAIASINSDIADIVSKTFLKYKTAGSGSSGNTLALASGDFALLFSGSAGFSSLTGSGISVVFNRASVALITGSGNCSVNTLSSSDWSYIVLSSFSI